MYDLDVCLIVLRGTTVCTPRRNISALKRSGISRLHAGNVLHTCTLAATVESFDNPIHILSFRQSPERETLFMDVVC